jgi:phosphoserine phosphatase RsbU/P
MATAVTQADVDVFEHFSSALHLIFENLRTGILLADRDGRIVFCNPAARKLVGATESGCLPYADTTTFAGWHLPDQTTPIETDHLPLARVLRGETVSQELVFHSSPASATRTEERVWIRVSGWPLRDRDGCPAGGVIAFDNCTRERDTQQSLALLSLALEQTSDNVFLTNCDGEIEYVNASFETTTGYSKVEAVGNTPRMLKSGLHDEGFYRDLWTRLQSGRPYRGMVINRRKNAGLYWAQQSIIPVCNEWGKLTHFISVAQDVTEQRQKQEQEFQLQLARDVQKQFYAPSPLIEGFDIGASACPAYETGGDYFDLTDTPDGSLLAAIGDVAGHGFGSALIMALTRAYLRSFVAAGLDLGEILLQMNQMLFQDLDKGRFVTIALARIDPVNHTLAFASAGHVAGFLISEPDTEVIALESTGPPLGLFPDSQFKCGPEVSLQPGQILLLQTDGAAESAATDGEEFGNERILNYVRQHRSQAAQEIADGIFSEVRNFVNHEPQLDDITTMLVKVGF